MMNPDTSEMVAVDATELLGLPRAEAGALVRRPSQPSALARLRADPQRMTAVRDSWRALWSSRLLIWLAGFGAVLVLGLHWSTTAFDPSNVTEGHGWLLDRLIAPFARWDSAWYLVIAKHGYGAAGGTLTSTRGAFFPLYPLVVGAIGQLGVPLVAAGILVSMGAFALALYGLHRLSTLEITAPHRWSHPDVARMTVLVTALSPVAFFLSAVYSESLYLALSIGVFWCARKGRWATACVLGAFAAATRSAGVVLVLPIALLYLYGPRDDRAPDRPSSAIAGPPQSSWRRGLLALRPRYRLRADSLWLALVPVGLAAFMGYLALSGGDGMTPFHVQAVWDRQFAGPFVAAWDGAVAAFDGARQLLSLQLHHVYFPAAGGSPAIAAQHNITLFLFLLAAIPALIAVLRALPFAYGAYLLAALAMPLSYPVSSQPLMSLPRFLLVLFPLNIWLGSWLARHPRARRPVFAAFGLLSVVFVAQFATWHWVA